jgi:plasmid maintenance system antidote protein VapI
MTGHPMDTAMTLNWLEIRRASAARARLDGETRVAALLRENARLTEELETLRRIHADLAASADMWIRLYELALARANRAEARIDREDAL